jgi:hypothetical protein
VKQSGFAWGFHAHKLINRQAVYSLPSGPLFSFFKTNIDYLTEQSVNPDKRRYTQEEEACRHYIDMEAYLDSNQEIPSKYFKDAKKRYSEDTLKKHGILPWQIYRVQGMLTKAMIEKDAHKILFLAADLGHYIGDANVPLHTTKNYDGQLTHQKGIHAFWESRLPELFSSHYDLWVGKASYVEDVQQLAWETVFASHRAVDSVLSMEAHLTAETAADEKYAFEDRNSVTVRVYSVSFAKKYEDALQGQVERQMASAIKMVADMWYTSWIEAGQPDLTNFPQIKNEEDKDQLKEKIKNDRFLESFRNCSHEHSSFLTLKN